MQRSGSQKALLVFSIIQIVLASLDLLGGLLSIAGVGLFGVAASQGDLTASEGIAGTTLVAILAFAFIVSGVWGLLCGIFGIRAANDNQKIMIVWVFTLIALILGVLGIIMTFVNGMASNTNPFSMVFSVVIDAVMFWIANNVKREAGK